MFKYHYSRWGDFYYIYGGYNDNYPIKSFGTGRFPITKEVKIACKVLNGVY